MANVMSLKKLRNKVSRNGFDLSRKVAFSAKVGELLPVECIECLPGDSFDLKKQHFTRTLPVNTAAYTRIREYYDWYFVPSNLLWNKFNNFVTQMVDNGQQAKSINTNFVLGDQHPYFSINDIAGYLARLNDNSGTLEEGETDYRKNQFGYNRAMLSSKLLQYLGYGSFYHIAGDQLAPHPAQNVLLNPFPLLAYQKIYQDFFRYSQWENAYAPAWNINYIDGTDLQIPLEDIDLYSENMFDLRYCNWNKDYFMGLVPNSQFGPVASVDTESLLKLSNMSGASIFLKSANNPNKNVVTESNGYISPEGNTTDYNWNIGSTSVQNIAIAAGLSAGQLISKFSILALRQAEAAQKWAEITQSTEQDYKSQMEAHFNVNVSDAYSERCKWLGGHVSNLDISEVVNQSLGESEATIKGKGVGVGEGKEKFTTDVHGYLMCIYHAVPILDYQITGIRKRNLKTRVTDYAIPEYDKTGMVKIPSIELSNTATDWAEFFNTLQLGYAPQYYEYKTSYDEVVGAFVNGGLGSWVAPFSDDYIQDYIRALEEQNVDSLTYHFFKVDPGVLNSIFVQAADATNTTDQLLVNCSFDIKALRNLDRDGLPY